MSELHGPKAHALYAKVSSAGQDGANTAAEQLTALRALNNVVIERADQDPRIDSE